MGLFSGGGGYYSRNVIYHKYTPRSSTCVVTRKSAIGDMAKLVTGDSTRKQSISLNKQRHRYLSVRYQLNNSIPNHFFHVEHF